VEFRRILAKMPFYAVRRGRQPGVYTSWPECEQQVRGFSRARYKKFDLYEHAMEFICDHSDDEGDYFGPPPTQPSNFNQYEQSNSRRMPPYMRHTDQYAEGTGSSSFSQPYQGGNKYVTVYSDGCCTNNGFQGARAGIGVYWGPGSSLNLSERLQGRQTNNRAEIVACCRALEQARDLGHHRVNLHTDSNFVVQAMTGWINNWKRNGWKLVTGEPVKNREDFERLDSLSHGMDVIWTHVRGHVGIEGNEQADQLARAGSLKNF